MQKKTIKPLEIGGIAGGDKVTLLLFSHRKANNTILCIVLVQKYFV